MNRTVAKLSKLAHAYKALYDSTEMCGVRLDDDREPTIHISSPAELRKLLPDYPIKKETREYSPDYKPFKYFTYCNGVHFMAIGDDGE